MPPNPSDVFPQALYDLYDFRYGRLSDVLAIKAAQQSSIIAYPTRAELDADLDPIANTPGLVLLDEDPANNCYYIKTGASGSGSWTAANWPFRHVRYVSEYPDLNTAIAALNATGNPETLLLNAPSTLVSSVTANKEIHIQAMNTGLVTLNAACLLTVNGNLEAGDYLVFVGLGAVAGLKEARPEWFGNNTTPGTTDMSAAVQAVINQGYEVVIPNGKTYAVKNLGIATAGQQIKVDGTLKLLGGANNDDAIFTATSVNGIHVVGSGTLDGNKANQSGAVSQQLIRFITCNNTFIGGGLAVKENYSGDTTVYAAIYVTGNNNIVDGLFLLDWSKEGVYLNENSYSSVSNVIAIDADGDSWSAVQVGGETSIHNRIENIAAKNTGASAVGMDSQYSTMNNILVDGVRFQNGVNLGHAGKPASYSTVSNIVVKNLTDNVNTGSAGLSIVNGTTGVTASNITVDGSTQKGINISAGATNILLKNVRLKDCAAGISMYQAGFVDIDGLFLEGAVSYGILKDSGASSDYSTLNLSNTDLTAATSKVSGAAGGLTSTYLNYTRVLNDNTAATVGTQAINGLGAGGTVTVTNTNARSHSRIILEPANVAGANSLPFISTQNDGSFVITTTNDGAAGASVRWRII